MRADVDGNVSDDVTIVIPCFNEEARLDVEGVRAILEDPRASVLFVDDGSSDGTLALLRRLERELPRVRVCELGTNAGKAEAVRAGLREAVADGAPLVAYLDADFATPPAEIARIIATLRESPALTAALGSRVALLGRKIERSPARHYLGRVFATAASVVLGVAVYDTQCGAKAFRVDDVMRRALALPFTTRWIFDVELLDRLLRGGTPASAIVEVPLNAWRDVAGSKLAPWAAAHAAADLARLAARRRRA